MSDAKPIFSAHLRLLVTWIVFQLASLPPGVAFLPSRFLVLLPPARLVLLCVVVQRGCESIRLLVSADVRLTPRHGSYATPCHAGYATLRRRYHPSSRGHLLRQLVRRLVRPLCVNCASIVRRLVRQLERRLVSASSVSRRRTNEDSDSGRAPSRSIRGPSKESDSLRLTQNTTISDSVGLRYNSFASVLGNRKSGNHEGGGIGQLRS